MAQTQFIAWSHSRRKTFMECPRQLERTAVLKKHDPLYVPYVEGKDQRDGKEVDEALCNRISKGTPLVPKFQQYEDICQDVLAAPGSKLTQLQLALDQSFKPCGSMEWDRVWVRAVIDLAIINGSHMHNWDWKNGKVWIDEAQLKLSSAIVFHTFPEIETIDTAFVWLRHGIISPAHYKRSDLADMWNDLMPDVERLQAAFKTNHWPPDPKRGAATCKWCPVNRNRQCDEAEAAYAGR